jgi:hypothetical protein
VHLVRLLHHAHALLVLGGHVEEGLDC